MADDIDIEEHDVMDNPKIKLIFPDLTKLKKEILEPYDEGPKEQQKEDMIKEHGFKLTDTSIMTLPGQIEELSVVNNHKNSVEIPQIISKPKFKKSNNVSENIVFFSNKIILGTKPNCEKKDDKINSTVKIVLKRIDDYLKKSTRYCNNCLILFSSKQILNKHINIWHSPCQVIKKSTVSKHDVNIEKMKAVKSTVQSNDNKNQQENLAEKCFHCNTLFLTQKSLIDHLYDVLDSKHTELEPKNVAVNDEAFIPIEKPIQIHDSTNNSAVVKTTTTSIDTSYTEVNYVYQCQVCSYYFNQEKFYEAHIRKKHRVKMVSYLSKVKFNSKCTFCSYEYVNIQYYNAHLLKRHKDIVYQKVLVNKNHNNEKISLSNNVCISEYSEKNRDSQMELSMNANNNDRPPIKDICTISEGRSNNFIFKSIVFKCATCHIHFLSSAVAINHVEHNQMLINWKCSICLKIFKRNDEELHTKQHQYSTSFTVHELCETDFKKVLFKCSMCAVHFMEEDILRHISSCEDEQVRSAYCNFCDILIDYKIKISHENSHTLKNMIPADFIVVNSSKSPKSHEKSSKYSKKKIQLNKSDLIKQSLKTKYAKKVNDVDTNPKPSSNKIKRKIDNINSNSDSDLKLVSVPTKRPKKDKMDIDNHNSDSDFYPKMDIGDYKDSDSDFNTKMDIGYDTDNDSDFKTYSSPLKQKKKSTVTDTSSDSDSDQYSIKFKRSTKIKKNKTAGDFNARSLTKRFRYKGINQLQLLNLTYCNLCECFISRTYKLDVHLNSQCIHILKRVCTYCGLIVTAKCSTSHKAFHKLNPHLKLQDFTFYDIKTNKVMCPPIPILPKCNICDKRFTSKVDIIGHICTDDDYTQCNICNIKLSDLAFKLHMPFHNYSLENKKNKASDFTPDNNSSIQMPNDTELNVPSLNVPNSASNSKISENSLQLAFLCKSCNLSVNTYDDLIEHCHSHYVNVETNVNTETCMICNLKFETISYKYHQELHSLSNKEDTLRIISFDIFYFGSSNEEWILHVFQSLSTEEKNSILQKSIYNLENRVKMKVKQPGPWNLTVYLCDKCRCFIDIMSVYKHVVSCNGKFYKNPCKFCGICFVSSVARINHEENVHKHPGIVFKSYRIVIFNSKEDKILNDAIANTYNRYVMYKCRNCSGVVDENHQNHKCHIEDLKKCDECGLLFDKRYYNYHVTKHKIFDSFIENNMKVILFGCKSEESQNQKRDIVCSFSGIVYDYTFYKCIKCDVCVRYLRPCSKHFCLIDAAKLKCSKCQLYFDEGKMKGHLKLHSSDRDFTRDNMMVIPFDPEECNVREDLKNKHFKGDLLPVCEKLKTKQDNDIKNSEKNNIEIKTDTIYKCACGLHHLTQSSMIEHCRKKCAVTKKTLQQTCSKCGLGFTPNVLFKHLLKHHGDKSILYKLEIIEV